MTEYETIWSIWNYFGVISSFEVPVHEYILGLYAAI